MYINFVRSSDFRIAMGKWEMSLLPQPELVSVMGRFVSVKEISGTISLYESWRKFFERIDADDLCIAYLKRLQKCEQIVKKQMTVN